MIGSLEEVVGRPDLLEIARRAVEDELIDLRDSGMFILRNNGFSVKERDGTPSNVMRLGTEMGMQIGLEAIIEHLKKEEVTS